MNNSRTIKAGDGNHALHLEVLYEVARLFAKYSNQEEMLTRILQVLEKRLEMTHGTIMLRTMEGDELVVEGTGGEVKYRKGEGVTGKVLETGLPELVPLISNEPRFQHRVWDRGQRREGEFSFICVPIILGNDTVGTLSVDLPHQGFARLQEAERLLSVVAGLIAHDVHGGRVARQERESLVSENRRLRDELGERFQPRNLVGGSGAMLEVFKRIAQVAPSDTTVLIRGESGTGKELAASAIHYASRRAAAPFVKVNCAALSENLLESELFGHEKGAFTGALSLRKGRFEEAEGGTLFLDEIGDFSPAVQVKLLRAVQEREFERVGSNKTLKADVRILAATNRDLEAAVGDGSFRNDLYYRVNVFPIHMPPLRDHKNDILQLANHFVAKLAVKTGKTITRVSTPAINMLLAYHWPGNVRELENCLEHAMLLANDGVIHGHDLPPTLQMPGPAGPPSAASLKSHTASLERDLIVDALKRADGNVLAASRELGVSDRMLRYKIEKLGIDCQALFNKRKRAARRSRQP